MKRSIWSGGSEQKLSSVKPHKAKGGVESGDYYAAVVIDKQFSRNMFRMLTEDRKSVV